MEQSREQTTIEQKMKPKPPPKPKIKPEFTPGEIKLLDQFLEMSLVKEGEIFEKPVLALPRMSRRAIGYVRTSTNKQDQSIDTQKTQITNWLNEKNRKLTQEGQKPYTLVHIFEDVGVSGKSMQRPAFEQMQNELMKDDLVIVTTLSRLGRNAVGVMTFRDKIRSIGITLAILDLQIDTTSESGEFLFNTMAIVKDLERKSSNRRIKEVLRDMVDKGAWLGMAPYGYTIKDKKLYLNPAEQPVICRIRELLIADADISLVKICKDLAARGYKTRVDTDFTASAVDGIIRRHEEMWTMRLAAKPYLTQNKSVPIRMIKDVQTE
jgi:DNA invertase Pin-like site-specific DNA recombinase